MSKPMHRVGIVQLRKKVAEQAAALGVNLTVGNDPVGPFTLRLGDNNISPPGTATVIWDYLQAWANGCKVGKEMQTSTGQKRSTINPKTP